MKQILLAAVILTLSLIHCFAQEPGSGPTGKVKGSVFDASGDAVILGLPVVIEGGGIKQTVNTNDNGDYEFNLPAGIYTITTDEKLHHERIYILKRGNLQVISGQTTVINLYPQLIYKVAAMIATKNKVRNQVPVNYKTSKFDSFTLSPPLPGNLVILFDQKKVHKGVIEYKYAKLSYNKLTLIAEEISFDKNKLQIKANGIKAKILIDNNGEKRRMSNANVELKDSGVVIQ